MSPAEASSPLVAAGSCSLQPMRHSFRRLDVGGVCPADDDGAGRDLVLASARKDVSASTWAASRRLPKRCVRDVMGTPHTGQLVQALDEHAGRGRSQNVCPVLQRDAKQIDKTYREKETWRERESVRERERGRERERTRKREREREREIEIEIEIEREN